MLAPMIATAYWGYCVKSKNHLPKGLPEGILFVLILIRFFCGYEFTTTIMLASEFPIVYYFIKETEPEMRKKWFWIAFKIGVLELLAFAFSFGILGIQNMLYTGENFPDAMATVIGAAKFRTGNFTDAASVAAYTENGKNIAKVENATGWSVLKMYLLSDVKIWGNFEFKQLLLLAVAAIAVKGVLYKDTRKDIFTEEVILLLSAVPAISWYYIGYGHAIFHEHVDYILWSIPFLPVCMGLIFKDGVEIYRYCKNQNR